jgi:hypothetical protein
MAKGIATGLLVASVVLLIIYGADAAAASSSPHRKGFLPLDDVVRGGALGGGAVVMSIIGFVIARKEYAPIISVLLFVNGGLIIAGMLALIAQGALSSAGSSGAVRTISSTMAMGAVLIGLGAWKSAMDRKTVVAKGKEPAQK